MSSGQRHAQIMALAEARGFVSVRDLADDCKVSEVTIRRDLEVLDRDGRLRRTFGGAYAVRQPANSAPDSGAVLPGEGPLGDRVDVLVATPVDPIFDRALLDRAAKRDVPIIAESGAMAGACTLVAVDNFQAGVALGRWAGIFAVEHFNGRAHVLDLTYQLENTRARSQGFLTGLREILPGADFALSVNAGPIRQSAYQLTGDVLDVHDDINIIFAINDAIALGARQACLNRGIAPEAMLLLPFGLEGNTLRDILLAGDYCKAGLAMFPEIVARVCVEAAVAAFRGRPLPEKLVTPHAVLTPETLPLYYTRAAADWRLNLETAFDQLHIPMNIDRRAARTPGAMPRRIGFVVPFSEHEWYRSLTDCLLTHAAFLGVDLEIVDAAKNMSDDVLVREREIARVAAEQVLPGDVVLIDGGGITAYLAEELACRDGITVITNSLPVLQVLRDSPGITLIATGGVLRRGTNTLSGPTTELTLRELPRGQAIYDRYRDHAGLRPLTH